MVRFCLDMDFGNYNDLDRICLYRSFTTSYGDLESGNRRLSCIIGVNHNRDLSSPCPIAQDKMEIDYSSKKKNLHRLSDDEIEIGHPRKKIRLDNN